MKALMFGAARPRTAVRGVPGGAVLAVHQLQARPLGAGHPHVRVIYNTVGTAESIEVSIRIAGPRSTVVLSGVDTPARFEWSPHYFKEVNLVGSNAFGVEEWNGKRSTPCGTTST